MSTKPFKNYAELVALLKSRGMHIRDEDFAQRKLNQIGYYRLSGFWHIARQPNADFTLSDQFAPNTCFDEICRLYLFDKKLRLLILDIVERFEIHLRNIIAHELGALSPLAYQDSYYININVKNNAKRFQQFTQKLTDKENRSHDDFVLAHRKKQMPLPFWASVELWDFGMLNSYFSLLKKRYQQKIVKHFGIDNVSVMQNWLREINIIRNQAAHHSRVWNRKSTPISIPEHPYFSALNLDEYSRERLFSRLAVLWFLVRQTSEHYTWRNRFNELVETNFPNVPNAKRKSMGMAQHSALPDLVLL